MAVTHLEEVLEGRAEEIDDHDVVLSLLSRIEDPRHAWAAHETLVYLGLVSEGAMFRDGRFNLDSNLLPRDVVHAIKYGA